MHALTSRFDDLLRALEAARLSDDELHRKSASLTERSASHDTLSTLRAEIAAARIEYMSGEFETHSNL